MNKSWPSHGVVVKVGGNKFEELEVLGRVQPVPQDRVSKQSMSEGGGPSSGTTFYTMFRSEPRPLGTWKGPTPACISQHSLCLQEDKRLEESGKSVRAGGRLGEGCCDLALEVEAQVFPKTKQNKTQQKPTLLNLVVPSLKELIAIHSNRSDLFSESE